MNCKRDVHNEIIESLYDTIVKSCLEAAEMTVPKKKRRLSSAPSVPWNQTVKPELDKAFFWYTIWKEFARPPEGWVCCYIQHHIFMSTIVSIPKNIRGTDASKGFDKVNIVKMF